MQKSSAWVFRNAVDSVPSRTPSQASPKYRMLRATSTTPTNSEKDVPVTPALMTNTFNGIGIGTSAGTNTVTIPYRRNHSRNRPLRPSGVAADRKRRPPRCAVQKRMVLPTVEPNTASAAQSHAAPGRCTAINISSASNTPATGTPDESRMERSRIPAGPHAMRASVKCRSNVQFSAWSRTMVFA